MLGISIRGLRWRWTLCDVRRRRRRSRICRVVRNAALHCVVYCYKNLTFCCSTNLRTTSTPKPLAGSNFTCKSTKARSSPLRTIAIFSTISPVGYSNSTTAAAFRTKGITRRGLNKRALVSPRNHAAKISCRKPSIVSSNGSVWEPRAVMPSPKLVSKTTKNSSRPSLSSVLSSLRSTFHPARGSAILSSRLTVFRKPTAKRFFSRTSNSHFLRAALLASSARTEPVKPRCFA